jgi:hypothetical protein
MVICAVQCCLSYSETTDASHSHSRRAFLQKPNLVVTSGVFVQFGEFRGGPAKSGPAEFDIISVKLHMTAREVTEVLSRRFGAKIDPLHGINVTKSPGKYNPATPYVSHVQYKTKDFFLTVEFAEIFPVSTIRREGAYRISYLAYTKTEADREAFKRIIVAKYGPPSTKGVGGSDMWCQAASCDLLQPFLEAGKSPLDPEFSLALRDEGFRRGMEEAFSKSKTVSPPL